MVTVKEPLSDFKDLGPVIYQESKILDNEIHLLCVHDNKEKKFVNFEAYSFESGKVTRIQWDYMNFDSHFRFNAELMNPNNREGRYHWICERLAFVSDGKGGRKLELCEPTDDLPQVADKARNFKIPTGRMNYGDRARLRLEMERLPKKRDESIRSLEEEFKERFVAGVMEDKELEARKNAMRMSKIEEERALRYEHICEQRRQESVLTFEYADRERRRDQLIKEKDIARKKAAHGEIMTILERQAGERKETERQIAEQRKAKQEEREQARQDQLEKITADEAAEERRIENWEDREDRLDQKAVRLQADRNAKIEARERQQQARKERQKELAHEGNTIRANLWAIHHEKDEKRKQDEQAALDAVKEAKEKSKNAMGLVKPKRKASKKKDGEEGSKMDQVEAKMREKMEKQSQQSEHAKKRDEKFERKARQKAEKEKLKADAWKDRQALEKEAYDEKLREKHEALEEQMKIAKAEAIKRKDQLARKNKMRESAIDRRVAERMKKLTAKFKEPKNEFAPF